MRIFLIAFIIIFLSLPLTYFVGVEDKTIIHGVETAVEKPTLQNQKYHNRSYQKAYDVWWNNNFMFRKVMLKTKNQIYDWLNLGQFHSGYSRYIIQGKHKNLLELGYLMTAYLAEFDDDNGRNNLNNIACKLAYIQSELKIRNIDFLFVLAPSKVRTFPETVPNRYLYFKQNKSLFSGYDLLTDQLQKNHVKYYNAQNLMCEIKKNELYPPFLFTGTHWSAYGVARTLQESLKLWGYADIKIKNVVMEKNPPLFERDLADLLNLWIKYKIKGEKYPKIIFEKTEKLNKKIGMIGDSFMTEFRMKMVDSGFADYLDIIYYENAPIDSNNIGKIMEQISLLIILYTEPNFISGETKKKIDLIYDYFENEKLNYELLGWHDLEEGRWHWSKSISMIKINKKVENQVALEIQIVSKLKPIKTVNIYCGDTKISEWDTTKWKFPQTEIVDIPSECFENGHAQLKFISDKVVTPESLGINNDKRYLSFKIENVRLIEKGFN
jgi:hypothetical protein